jgi:hypothetical protein
MKPPPYLASLLATQEALTKRLEMLSAALFQRKGEEWHRLANALHQLHSQALTVSRSLRQLCDVVAAFQERSK